MNLCGNDQEAFGIISDIVDILIKNKKKSLILWTLIGIEELFVPDTISFKSITIWEECFHSLLIIKINKKEEGDCFNA